MLPRARSPDERTRYPGSALPHVAALMRATSMRCSPEREIDPDRNVVGRLLPVAHMLIDAGRGEPVGGLRRKQEMVDANSIILLPGAGLIVPERKGARAIARGANSVRQSEIA